MRRITTYVCIGCMATIPLCGAPSPKKSQKTYEWLISVTSAKLKIPYLKNNRIQQLESLAASTINRALDRVINILGKSAHDQAKDLKTYIAQFKNQASDYVKNAFPYAIEEFERQIEQDNNRLNGTSSIASFGQDRKEDLISSELEVLNERYTPILTALKKLKPDSLLPDALSLKVFTEFKLPHHQP